MFKKVFKEDPIRRRVYMDFIPDLNIGVKLGWVYYDFWDFARLKGLRETIGLEKFELPYPICHPESLASENRKDLIKMGDIELDREYNEIEMFARLYKSIQHSNAEVIIYKNQVITGNLSVLKMVLFSEQKSIAVFRINELPNINTLHN